MFRMRTGDAVTFVNVCTTPGGTSTNVPAPASISGERELADRFILHRLLPARAGVC